MIATRFDYAAPGDVAGCLTRLDAGARALAGGTWVLPEMGRGESAPTSVVDLRRAGLRTVELRRDRLHIGAMTTYSDLLTHELVARHAPLLVTMSTGVTGGAALHNQATVGGSIAAARVGSDVPGALVGLGAWAHVAGARGDRTLMVADLVLGARRTALDPGELITGFSLPSALTAGHGYVKVKRGSSSWPVVTAAALVRRDAADQVTEVSLTIGAVAQTPVTLDPTGLLEVVGEEGDGPSLTAALARVIAAHGFDPWEDELAPARYRAAVAAPVGARALRQALVSATSGGVDRG